IVVQSLPPALPSGSTDTVGGFDVGNATLPIEVVHTPGPPSQKQDPGFVLLAEERHLSDETQLLPTVEHRKQRGGYENRDQLQEVLAAKLFFAPLPEPEDSLFFPENLLRQHPLHDLLSRRGRDGGESRHKAHPVVPGSAADPAFLQGQGHQLLSKDM